MLLQGLELVPIQIGQLLLQESEAIADSLGASRATKQQTRKLHDFRDIVDDFNEEGGRGAENGQEQNVGQPREAVHLLVILWLVVALRELDANDAALLGHEGRQERGGADHQSDLVVP